MHFFAKRKTFFFFLVLPFVMYGWMSNVLYSAGNWFHSLIPCNACINFGIFVLRRRSTAAKCKWNFSFPLNFTNLDYLTGFSWPVLFLFILHSTHGAIFVRFPLYQYNSVLGAPLSDIVFFFLKNFSCIFTSTVKLWDYYFFVRKNDKHTKKLTCQWKFFTLITKTSTFLYFIVDHFAFWLYLARITPVICVQCPASDFTVPGLCYYSILTAAYPIKYIVASQYSGEKFG